MRYARGTSHDGEPRAAVAQWDAAFNAGYRARLAAVDAIPPGPFLAIDAAAWRYASGRRVLVTPADGVGAAMCAAAFYDARSIVLEDAHFASYDALYGGELVGWLGRPIERGSTKVYPIVAEIHCGRTVTP